MSANLEQMSIYHIADAVNLPGIPAERVLHGLRWMEAGSPSDAELAAVPGSLLKCRDISGAVKGLTRSHGRLVQIIAPLPAPLSTTSLNDWLTDTVCNMFIIRLLLFEWKTSL